MIAKYQLIRLKIKDISNEANTTCSPSAKPADFMTFRVGLFGLEKLHNADRTVEQLAKALNRIAVG